MNAEKPAFQLNSQLFRPKKADSSGRKKSSSSYLFISPKRRACIFKVFLRDSDYIQRRHRRHYRLHCKNCVLDFLGIGVVRSDGAGRTWSTSGSRTASSLREADLPCGSCRGLALRHGLALLHPLCRDRSLSPLEASTWDCCCSGSPELTGCYLGPYRLCWRSWTGWPAGRPCCRKSRLFSWKGIPSASILSVQKSRDPILKESMKASRIFRANKPTFQLKRFLQHQYFQSNKP